MEKEKIEEYLEQIFEEINANGMDDIHEFLKKEPLAAGKSAVSHMLIFAYNGIDERIQGFKEYDIYSKYLLIKWLSDGYEKIENKFIQWPSMEVFRDSMNEIERALYKDEYHKMMVTGDIIDYIKSKYPNCIVAERLAYENVILEGQEDYIFFIFCNTMTGICLTLGIEEYLDLTQWVCYYRVTDNIILLATNENYQDLKVKIQSLQDLDNLLMKQG